ncbi:MAG: hypothetical protein ABSG96_25890, partial [Terracidiphilus sp.]
MFDPDAHMPRINRGMVYLGACLIAGIRLARERQVNVRVSPTGNAIEESVDLATRFSIGRFGRCREESKTADERPPRPSSFGSSDHRTPLHHLPKGIRED